MAKLGTTNIGGGGGVGSDELTVTKDKVVEGYTYVGADTDDEIGNGAIPNKGPTTASQSVTTSGGNLVTRIPNGAYITNASSGYPEITSSLSSIASAGGLTAAKLLSGQAAFGISGTATSDATATDAYVYAGKTYYRNGVKGTGTLSVQSILSFSTAVYSSTAIAFTWKNPAKGPFSGIIIVGKTGGYPTSITDGTRYYKGVGNNSAASGTSSATISSFVGGTTYYFRGFSYAIKDNTEWVHTTTYTASATTTKGQQVFTSSGTFTVPANVRTIDIFCVGGGGGGRSGYSLEPGAGGGGGYTKTVSDYAVTPGGTFAVSIGAGGGVAQAGGSTSFGSVVVANGGSAGLTFGGGDGGSGGGGSGEDWGGNGGSDGSNGVDGSEGYGGIGQGTSTRAFGEPTNTLYAGGGGGGAKITNGAGGSGGGGAGGDIYDGWAVAGTANTGGGGGGGAQHASDASKDGKAGGSGICIIRWGY